MKRWFVVVGCAGCAGEGVWQVETWGEDYIEREIPAEVFADGCSAAFTRFEVNLARVALVDGDGVAVGELDPARFDLRDPGPVPVGELAAPADHYDELIVEVGPDAVDAVSVAGTLTCDGASATFDWAFSEATTYVCAPSELTIPPGGADATQITIHGDHLFYDGLENPDAAVRGRELLAADADADGAITLAELDAVSVPALGFEVGQRSDVLTLAEFVGALTGTLVHVDGEGECRIGG